MQKILHILCLTSIASLMHAANNLEASIWTVHSEPSSDSPPMHVKMDQWTIASGDWFMITDNATQKNYWVHASELDKKNIKLQCKTQQTTQGNAHSVRYNHTTIEEWDNIPDNIPTIIQKHQEWLKELQQSLHSFFTPQPMKTHEKIRLRLLADLHGLFNI